MLNVGRRALMNRNLKAGCLFASIIFIELALFYNANLVIYYGELWIYSFKSIRNILFLFVASITFTIMSKVLFQYETGHHTYSKKMPLSNRPFLGSKWIAGVLTITTAFVLEYIVLNCILIGKNAWTLFIQEVSIRYLAVYMMALFIFAFICLIQSINFWALKENLTAILLSVIPVSVLLHYYGQYSFFMFSNYFSGNYYGFWCYIFTSILTGLFSFCIPITNLDYLGDYFNNVAVKPDIIFPTLKICGIYLTVSIVFFSLSWFMFGRIKEKNSNVSLIKSIIRFAAAFVVWLIFIVTAAFIQGCIKKGI